MSTKSSAAGPTVAARSENRARPVPVPTPETRHFWEATQRRELRLQRCEACRHIYFPPRPFCPKCSSDAIAPEICTGRAKLYSYVISHRPAPGFEAPFAIAVVELEEGPRMMTSIKGCAQTPEELQLDMELEVDFEAISDEISLPFFKPAVAQ